MSYWPQYHRDGGNPEGVHQRRHAAALHGLIMYAWREAYARQVTELRKRAVEDRGASPPEKNLTS